MYEPLKAAPIDNLDLLRYPLYASIKIDGIRAILHQGKLYSRSGKLLPNLFLQDWAASLHVCMNWNICHLDGELTIGKINDDKCFNRTQSGIMTIKERPDFYFNVFDCIMPHTQEKYNARLAMMHEMLVNYRQVLGPGQDTRINPIHQVKINNREELERVIKQAEYMNYEGLILRDPDGLYKYGRSTFNEHKLLKYKFMEDDEGEIVACHEYFINDNPQEDDEFGYAKRSSHQENMIHGEMLGSFEVRCPKFEKTFKVGSGFTHEQRKALWINPHENIGKTISFRYTKHGVKDVPRQPIFKGFRHD